MLVPYQREIGLWQRQDKSYREIAALLRVTHGLEVHHDTIHSFVQARIRLRKRKILPAEYLVTPSAPTPGRLPHAIEAVRSASAVAPKSNTAGRILSTEGKEICGAQYPPVDPNNL
jgi:hypothetical protein